MFNPCAFSKWMHYSQKVRAGILINDFDFGCGHHIWGPQSITIQKIIAPTYPPLFVPEEPEPPLTLTHIHTCGFRNSG